MYTYDPNELASGKNDNTFSRFVCLDALCLFHGLSTMSQF